MKKLLILIFLTSCVQQNYNINSNQTQLNFDNDLSFDQFNKLLTQYAEKKPYPNID